MTYNRAVSKATMCAEESEAYKQLDAVGKQRVMIFVRFYWVYIFQVKYFATTLL